MFLLGFIVATCYLSGYTGSSIPTQWVVLSAILPLGLWRYGPFGPGHWLGLATLAYASASSLWAANGWDSLFGLWLIFIWAGSFWLGSTTYDLERLFKGLALGLTVSSIVAIFQWYGHSPVITLHSLDPDIIEAPGGLLYNPTLLGATVALVLVALVEFRLWWWIPGLLPALLLCQSRGAWVILAVGLIARRVHWLIVLSLVATLGVFFIIRGGQSDAQRLYLWSIGAYFSSIFGNGIGSFTTLYYFPVDLLFHQPVKMVRPEFVHNDYIQLWFELGVGAIPIYLLYAITLTQRGSGWATFVAFTVLSIFYFPLWCPTTAFIGCVLAGRGIADWHLSRSPSKHWRSSFLSGHSYWRPFLNRPRGQAIPAKSAS